MKSVFVIIAYLNDLLLKNIFEKVFCHNFGRGGWARNRTYENRTHVKID